MYKIKSVAKINIGLNVVRKREDGFHDLETFFYPLEKLHDVITIEENSTLEIITDSPALKNHQENLIYKAVKLLEKHSDKEIKVKITLEKNIPIGGGLGGGSSNAAATLVSVNKLLNLNFSTQQLEEIALLLGSDVPFFVKSKPALGFSRGEVLEEFELHLKKPILLVNPNIHISTADAFASIIPKKPPTSIKEILTAFPNPVDWEGKITNDFEQTVFPKFPILQEIKSKLYKYGALFALMSGTGATVYGIFNDQETATEAQKAFGKKFWTKIV